MDTQQPDILPWHRESWQAINRQLQQQRLSHAYLLQGESGIGKRQFVEALAERLLTYALGRGLESYDRPAVRDIRRRAEADGYRFSALVEAIVDSVPFRLRRIPE